MTRMGESEDGSEPATGADGSEPVVAEADRPEPVAEAGRSEPGESEGGAAAPLGPSKDDWPVLGKGAWLGRGSADWLVLGTADPLGAADALVLVLMLGVGPPCIGAYESATDAFSRTSAWTGGANGPEIGAYGTGTGAMYGTPGMAGIVASGEKNPRSRESPMIVSIRLLMSSPVMVPVSGAGGDTLMLIASKLPHRAAVPSSAVAWAALASRTAEVAVNTATACRYMMLPDG
ncbi:hypothetical protein AB0I81_16260 [Nonomuraea sp. NPDC050404]|uniref:hypothetical protein n=1 Tax=Nonomuraea sp. NPDC050404 TaxID=3155783 RepID=UPI0033DDFBCA